LRRELRALAVRQRQERELGAAGPVCVGGLQHEIGERGEVRIDIAEALSGSLPGGGQGELRRWVARQQTEELGPRVTGRSEHSDLQLSRHERMSMQRDGRKCKWMGEELARRKSCGCSS